MKVTEAIEILSSTYQDLNSVASGLNVNANEVAEALKKATPDTTEFVCLTALAKAHPVVNNIKSDTKQESKKHDGNTEQQ